LSLVLVAGAVGGGLALHRSGTGNLLGGPASAGATSDSPTIDLAAR
jgi:hypothetical protein